mmetsp:Transcript_19912/g.49543  ORF Transcript_19912/g.49543 Transcript_19912/m.49543 type:complete len:259 (-) Transcript_19912:70-846(-)
MREARIGAQRGSDRTLPRCTIGILARRATGNSRPLLGRKQTGTTTITLESQRFLLPTHRCRGILPQGRRRTGTVALAGSGHCAGGGKPLRKDAALGRFVADHVPQGRQHAPRHGGSSSNTIIGRGRPQSGVLFDDQSERAAKDSNESIGETRRHENGGKTGRRTQQQRCAFSPKIELRRSELYFEGFGFGSKAVPKTQLDGNRCHGTRRGRNRHVHCRNLQPTILSGGEQWNFQPAHWLIETILSITVQKVKYSTVQG